MLNYISDLSKYQDVITSENCFEDEKKDAR